MIRRTRTYAGPERRRIPRWRSRPLRVLVALLCLAAAGYVGAVLWLLNQETRLVFRAGSTLATGRPAFAYEQVQMPRADGARQFAWVMPRDGAPGGPWVVYLHGNASSVASQVNIAHYRVLRNVGLNVLAAEYHGFGGLDGVPTEATLQADARAAYDYLRISRGIPAHNVALYGWSLGSAVALDLAARLPPAAIVLEGAPASLVDLTSRRYPFFPLRLLMRSQFDSIRKIGGIPAPMLFLHGVDDQVVPIAEGRRLFEAARGVKMFVEVRGGHVNAIEHDAAQFESALLSFLSRIGFLRGGAPDAPRP